MKKLLLILISFLMLVACTTSKKEEVKKVELEYAINGDLETIAQEVFDTYYEKNMLPGMTIVVVKDSKVILEKAFGYSHLKDKDESDVNQTYANPTYKTLENPTEMKVDTMFDLASVTKAFATTQAIMKLVSEKKIDIKEKVATYLPGFEKNGKENVTVDQLLTHTSGLPQWLPTYLYVNNSTDLLEYIKNVELNKEFLESDKDLKSTHYSDLGFMTLGYIVEAVSNKTLDKYVQEEIYKPLGLTRTTFNPLSNGFNKEDIAATSLGNPYEYRMIDEVNYPNVGYDCTSDKDAFDLFKGFREYTLQGEVNDGNAWMAANGVAGHAGLFSTAYELAVICEVMQNQGTYQGVTLYDEETLKTFTSQHTNIGKEASEFGYCFKLDQSWMGDTATINAYGHDGFTGTTVSIDTDNHLTIVCLTNKMQDGFRYGENQNTNLYWNTNVITTELVNKIREKLGL